MADPKDKYTGMTQARVKELMHYDPDTGIFRWLTAPKYSSRKPGDQIDVWQAGYYRTCIDGRKYFLHRLAWLYVHGVWPDDQLDHINGDKLDNRLVNLRPATKAENRRNAPGFGSVSGVKGVYPHKYGWIARIRLPGNMMNLGVHKTISEAAEAYRQAAVKYHGEFSTTRGDSL